MSSELTLEEIQENELHYSYGSQQGDWKVVHEDSNYDDGYEYHDVVVQNVVTGEYWQFSHATNSWDSEPLRDQDLDIKRVEPREVMVTQYFPLG